MFNLISKTKLIDNLCMMIDEIEAAKQKAKEGYDNGEINEWSYYKHLWNLRGRLSMLDEIVNKLRE